MTATSQDFTIYAGDAAVPIFTVKDDSGAVIDISTVDEIEWVAQRDPASSAVIRKTKTGGGITFVTDGTDGKFQVSLTAADTSALTAYYLHQAVITDQTGNPTTVATGRMRVGRLPVATYSGDPANSDRDAVRFYVQDTDPSKARIMDAEIDWLLTKYPGVLFAAAQGAKTIAARYATAVTKSVGDLSIQYSQMSKNYYDLAERLTAEAERTGATIYAGGISKADMLAVASDSDRLPENFQMHQFDIPNASDATLSPDAESGW